MQAVKVQGDFAFSITWLWRLPIAKAKYKLERIAVVDFDVHHGDGTQACFYDIPEVLYISYPPVSFLSGAQGILTRLAKATERDIP